VRLVVFAIGEDVVVATNPSLDLGEGLLDGIKIGRVWREIHEADA
jgi:hypothetical protein